MSEVQPRGSNAVVLAERIAAGQAFGALFRQGMSLVENVAAYLDGPGRKEAKALARSAALAYATESMRLTTRLMQLASWLLLQRAVNEGELTIEQAKSEKTKVKLAPFQPPHEESLNALPKRLRQLIDDSRKLHEAVQRMDALVYGGAAPLPSNDNPVRRQLGLLQAAFGAESRRA